MEQQVKYGCPPEVRSENAVGDPGLVKENDDNDDKKDDKKKIQTPEKAR